jgi:hypothetical protein
VSGDAKLGKIRQQENFFFSNNDFLLRSPFFSLYLRVSKIMDKPTASEGIEDAFEVESMEEKENQRDGENSFEELISVPEMEGLSFEDVMKILMGVAPAKTTKL